MREPILRSLQNALQSDARFHDAVRRDAAAAVAARGYTSLTDQEIAAVRQMADQTPRPRRFAPRRDTALVMGAFVLLVGGGIAWGLAGFHADVERRTAQAAPQALDYTPVTWMEDQNGVDSRRNGYDVRYSFTAGGQVHQGTRTRDESFNPDARYIICYNPADPSDFGFYRADRVTCGKP